MVEAPMADTLSLRGLHFDCILGVYHHERLTPQPIELDVSLTLDVTTAARQESIATTVDYARLAGELRFLLSHSHFLLLESAAEAVAAWVLMPPSIDVKRAPVQRVTVRLAKSRALALSGIASIELNRTAKDFDYTTEVKQFGFVDIVYETKNCGIYRERISPGCTVPTHVHHSLDESELVLGEGLLVQGKPVDAGVARVWPKDFAHRWDNPTDREQSFLCIDRPKFLHSDEVEVDIPVEQLKDVYPQRYF